MNREWTVSLVGQIIVVEVVHAFVILGNAGVILIWGEHKGRA
jgi:hypothetical protein